MAVKKTAKTIQHYLLNKKQTNRKLPCSNPCFLAKSVADVHLKFKNYINVLCIKQHSVR